MKLDAAVSIQEATQDVEIGFWHVPRLYVAIADALANEAAKAADLA